MAARPGKYAHVTATLPKLPGVEPERKAIVEAVQQEILTTEPHSYNLDAQARKLLDDMSEHLQLAVDLVKGVAGGRDSARLAKGYVAASHLLDRVQEWRGSAQLLVDAYELLTTGAMEAEGVTSIRMVDGAGVSTYQEPYGSVVDKEAFRRWCVANGYEQQLQLWPSTMNALTKERLLAGEATPDGVEVFAKTVVRLNKA